MNFQRQHGFFLDVGRFRASSIFDGYQFQGKLNDGAIPNADEESLRVVVEDGDVGEAIRALTLSEFSKNTDIQEEFRRVIWE